MSTAGTPTLETSEFRYTGDESLERFGAAGWSHFRTMTNGVVFVDRWGLRLPVVRDGVESFTMGGLKKEQKAPPVTRKVSRLTWYQRNRRPGAERHVAERPAFRCGTGCVSRSGDVNRMVASAPAGGARDHSRDGRHRARRQRRAIRDFTNPSRTVRHVRGRHGLRRISPAPDVGRATGSHVNATERSTTLRIPLCRLDAITKVTCGKTQPEGTGLIVGRVRGSQRVPERAAEGRALAGRLASNRQIGT